MTASDKPPFESFFDLGDLGRSGADVRVEADEAARHAIARWADIRAVESFAASLHLRRHSADRFDLDGNLAADVVQDCVVTLEPVRSRIERHIHRELHLSHHIRHKPGEVIPLGAGAGDDEEPEEIDSPTYDLAAPLLEEFSLALDPYPRAPGVEFTQAEAPEDRPENPFAVLKSLKNRT